MKPLTVEVIDDDISELDEDYGPVPSINTVKAWANRIATDDNDMIQLRKKNGIIYVMKVAHHKSNKWEKLDPTDVAVITDVHGAKLEDVDLATLRAELGSVGEKIEIQEPESYEIGWYQDSKGDLYQFDGETWLGNVPSKKETNHLEFLG